LIHTKDGKYIWCFILFQFHYWWLDHVQDSFPLIFNDVTLTHPLPIFDDSITHNIKKWNNHTKNGKEMKLPDLAKVCNYLLIPKIMCLWGEYVFLHKCRSISINIIFQCY
jgi:hypothetical protein